MAKVNQETVTKLRRLLGSWTVFYQKAHTFHWDLVGNNFNELHKYFEELYRQSVEQADSIAERIRQIGEKTALSLTSAVGDSVVEDNNGAEDARSMVAGLITGLAQLTVLQSEIYNEADEQGDYVTADLMTQLSKWNEFNSWFLSSWMGQPNETHV